MSTIRILATHGSASFADVDSADHFDKSSVRLGFDIHSQSGICVFHLPCRVRLIAKQKRAQFFIDGSREVVADRTRLRTIVVILGKAFRFDRFFMCGDEDVVNGIIVRWVFL